MLTKIRLNSSVLISLIFLQTSVDRSFIVFNEFIFHEFNLSFSFKRRELNLN